MFLYKTTQSLRICLGPHVESPVFWMASRRQINRQDYSLCLEQIIVFYKSKPSVYKQECFILYATDTCQYFFFNSQQIMEIKRTRSVVISNLDEQEIHLHLDSENHAIGIVELNLYETLFNHVGGTYL